MKKTREPRPSDWNALLTQMLQGIQEAQSDALLQQKPHTVRKGILEQTEAEGFQYRFQFEEAWEPAPNTRVGLRLDPEQPQTLTAGMILDVVHQSLRLLTSNPLPEAALDTLVFYEDHLWLLNKAYDALLRVQGQGATPLSEQAFCLRPSGDRSGKRMVSIPSFLPRPDQTKAIERGMESPITIVVGAAGTGKTSTECALILEYLLAGKTVLLTALTNRAVDSAMQCLDTFCKESEHKHLIQDHQLVRLGITSELDDKHYGDITLKGIINQRLGRLSQEREQLHQVLIPLCGERESLQTACSLLKTQEERLRKRLRPSYTKLCAERAQLEQREHQRSQTFLTQMGAIAEERRIYQRRQQALAEGLREMGERLSTLQRVQAACVEKLDAAQEALIAFRARSFVSSLFAWMQGISEPTLRANEQHCQHAVTEAKAAAEEQAKQQRQHTRQLEQIKEHLTDLDTEEQRYQQALHMRIKHTETLDAVTRSITKIEDRWQQAAAKKEASEEHLRQTQQEIEQITTQLATIKAKERPIRREVLQEARLIGTTLTGLTTNTFFQEHRQFDAVILDEASMASLVHVLLASSYATRHLVCFGDPHQFLPIIALKEPKSRPKAAYWLGTDLFSYRHVKLEDADADRNHVVFLEEQARMHPIIAEPLSRRVYGGRLRNSASTQDIASTLEPHPEWPLMVIDTGDVDRDAPPSATRRCLAKRLASGISKYNEYHIQCVVQLVHSLHRQFALNTSPQIGVVTPYAAQSRKIQRALQEQELYCSVEVGTAYRFQGAEYPCMIFDTVDGYGLPIGQFLSDVLARDDAPTQATRLITVAHSRAQNKLIYLANISYIRQDGYRKNHFLTHFINDVYACGHMDSALLFGK